MSAYLLYGKSGSGKGTQAVILKTKLESLGKKVIVIETGKLFRNFTQQRNDFMGNHVRSVVDSGELMPVFFPIYLWADQLIQHYTGTEDIIFDGVSRRIEEAPILDSALDFLNITNRYVIDIKVSDAWVFDHMGNRPDRTDDTAEGMTKRLAWFNNNVAPVIEYFKNNNKYTFVSINGEQSIEEVAHEIEQII
jgi:adenylate kinase